MNKEVSRKQIQQLIDKYEKVKASHLIFKYTEEETKKDFIQPLFQALGWNTTDKNEVSAEQVLSAGRIDYGFYLNGRLKFNVEAKSLKTALNREDYANQAVKYSWNKGATWAVLTDFENLKVFNAQVIDRFLADKQFFDIPYDKYIERFDQLWLLSKEAFTESLLDKEAEKVGKKLQTVSVGALLYKDLNECRDILTHVLSMCNPKVDKDLLDEGVQKLLDRLIFLRVAEDRGIEGPILKELLREHEEKGGHKFQSMIKKFRELDEIYNSNLFSEHPFEKWEEYGDATEKVIKILYGKPGYYEYDFKAMPADVLGGVYENYLGYRLEKSRKGLSVSKDANKRKESGIYYTPDFIVDYIVSNTLKPVLDKCTSIEQLKKIKVLDPACGSGSFLIKALEVIYKKYQEFKISDGFLTKIQILQENIYGVDLDPQAVEIARLNLLINALDTRMKLPGLDKNIKNGNSLISGTDEDLTKYFGKNFRDKKPFNWQEEFPEVFKQGGFDVVIGNPPYISYYSKQSQSGNKTKEELEYLINKSDFIKNKSKLGRFNTLMFFVELFIKLSKPHGSLGLIVDTNLQSNPSKDIREYISKNTTILTITNEIKAFENVASSQIILILRNCSCSADHKLSYKRLIDNQIREVAKKLQGEVIKDPYHSFEEPKNKSVSLLLEKIEHNPSLENLVGKNHIRTCITFTGKKDYFIKSQKESSEDLPLLEGSNALPYPYAPLMSNGFVSLNVELRDKLNKEYRELSNRENRRSPMVIGLGPLRQYSAPKIFIRLSDKRVTASFTKKVVAADLSLYILTLPNLEIQDKKLYLLYLLAILNSQAISFYMKESNLIRNLKTGTPQIRLTDIRSIPIPKSDKGQQIKLSSVAQDLLDLNERLIEVDVNSNKWNSLKTEIEKTDRKIDEEVYKLYGLSDKEIEIVEGAKE